MYSCVILVQLNNFAVSIPFFIISSLNAGFFNSLSFAVIDLSVACSTNILVSPITSGIEDELTAMTGQPAF